MDGERAPRDDSEPADGDPSNLHQRDAEMVREHAACDGETVPGVISKGGEEGRDRHATQGERVPLRALHAGEASRGDAGEDGVGVEGNGDAAREFDVGVDAEES